MTLSLLGLLVLLSAVASWSRRRMLARGIGVFTVLLFLAVACGPVPASLLENLQSGYSTAPFIRWSTRNVIVLLAAGTTRLEDDGPLQPTLFADSRIIRAVALYRACKTTGEQCLMLVTGGDSQKHGTAESTVYAGVLTGLCVLPKDIQTETLSVNTFENARYSRELILVDDPQTMVLVTSGFHLRRSLIEFAHFSMRPTPVSGDQLGAELSLLPSASNLMLTDLAFHEYIGIAQYYVDEKLGWNTMPVLGPIKPTPAA